MDRCCPTRLIACVLSIGAWSVIDRWQSNNVIRLSLPAAVLHQATNPEIIFLGKKVKTEVVNEIFSSEQIDA
jgi:hypothetical protein